MKYAEVAVDAPTGHDRTFSYSVPSTLPIGPGHLVRVPFGSRRLQGIVFSMEAVPQVAETREVQGLYYDEPVLDEAHLELARWISRHYMCSLFEAAAPMLPPGGRSRPKTLLSLSSDFAGLDELPAAQQRVVTYLRGKDPVNQERLVRALGESARRTVDALVRKGAVARSQTPERPGTRRKYAEYVTLLPEAGPDVAQWLEDAPRRAPRQAAFLARLLEGPEPMALTGARKEFGAAAVAAVLKRGWLQKEKHTVDRDPLEGKAFPPARPVVLTTDQGAVTKEIRGALDDASSHPRTFLVQGVTGSGKTEVYLDAVEHCLRLGKRAMVMVPEISLTHQTIERFASRFPGQVAVLHSGLSDGQRFDQWWKTSRGDYGVVIGSRSAVFAPQPSLGLIVLDEEHEWTYKQHDAAPRYHARDVALRFAASTGAIVLLGSASPDLVSYHRALRDEYRLFRLPERVADDGPGDAAPAVPRVAPLADIHVVDMRQELREGNRHIFSRELTDATQRCLESGGQAILFLNRRGSSSYLQCRNCGFNLKCRRCDIALTYHREVDRMLCHYCGSRRRAPVECPRCRAYRMSYYGAGTQTVAQEARDAFPGARVLRWDSDAARSAGAHEEILERFRSGGADILVGTQMIAKGLHIPAVTLVGVVSADVGLNIPDYRAGERAFQVLCQVSGRAGRGPAGGSVIVQTFQPENYAIAAAAAQDYQAFYDKETAFRREQGNPPFSRLVRLVCAHTDRAYCEREASRFAEVLREHRDGMGYSDTEVIGPTPAYPPRLRGRYRWHVVLRGPSPRSLLDDVAMPQNWTVDVDPVALT